MEGYWSASNQYMISIISLVSIVAAELPPPTSIPELQEGLSRAKMHSPNFVHYVDLLAVSREYPGHVY